MAETFTVRVSDGGRLNFIYDDALVGLLRVGPAQVTRASHVEPHPSEPGWLADMSPSGGPTLAKNGAFPWSLSTPGQVWNMAEPFPTRAEALAAERAWLKEHRGL